MRCSEMQMPVLVDAGGNGAQAGATTGAGHALAGAKLEDGAMRGANELTVAEQEFSRGIVQAPPGMRADVQPGAYFFATPAHDDRFHFAADLGIYLRDGAVFQISQMD
jgi:hypothetical protein